MLETEAFSSMVRSLVTHLELDVGEDISYFASAIPKLAFHLAPRSLEMYILNLPENEEPFDWELERDPRIQEAQRAFLGCFPTIVSLNLSMTCGTFAEVIEMITSFPLLQNLKLSSSWDDESEIMLADCNNRLLLPKEIRSLSLCPVEPFFLRWLLQHGPLQRPSSLDLRLYESEFVHGQLIRQAGSSLAHLKINSTSDALLSEHINLEESPNLRSLHVIVWENAVKIVLRLLSGLPGSSTTVEDVEFQAWEAGSDSVVGLWAELDLLLAGPRFAKLRKVTVGVLKTHSSIVKERLVRVDSLKILRLKDQSGDLLN
ncbi:hypothetical protein C0991_000942 [Blastosporella zonata]|nr:hypothetical protein C0991_000942 [Blastosporella zonata]